MAANSANSTSVQERAPARDNPDSTLILQEPGQRAMFSTIADIVDCLDNARRNLRGDDL